MEDIKFYLAIIFGMITIISFILTIVFALISYNTFCKELDEEEKPCFFEVDDQGNKFSDFIGKR